MTEYDYSPEAYDRYLATQTRIASWVDDTETHRPEFEHALNTIAPSPSTPPPHHQAAAGPSRSGSGSSGSGSFTKLLRKRKTTAPPPAALPLQGYGPPPPAYAAAQYAMHYAAVGPSSSARVASRTATPVYTHSVSSDEYDYRKGPGPMPITSPTLAYPVQQQPQPQQPAQQQYYQLRVPTSGGYMVPAPGAQYGTAKQQQLYQPLSAGATGPGLSSGHHAHHRSGHRSSRSSAAPHVSSRVASPSSLRSPTGYYTMASPVQSPVGYVSGYSSAGTHVPMASAGGYFVMQHPGQRPVLPMYL